MRSDPGAVRYLTPTNWTKAAARCQFAIQPLLQEAGIDAALLRPGELIALEADAAHQLMRRCVAAAAPRWHFPFVLGEMFAFEHIPAMEAFLTTSHTPRESLRVFDWITQLVPSLRTGSTESGDSVTLTMALDEFGADPEVLTCFTEIVFAAVHRFAKLLLGERPMATLVSFKYGAPERLAAYERMFQCPVLINNGYDGAVVPRGLLDMALPGAFPALHERAEESIRQALRPAEPEAPAEPGNVKVVIEQAYAEHPQWTALSLEQMAEKLAMHPRTLQRRLSECGASFARVQTQARAGIARAWLREGRGDIDALGEFLGFSDRESFVRAFKRWTGETPQAFVRRHPSVRPDR